MITDLQVIQTQCAARVPITIFELVGELDSSNVESFQTEAQQAIDNGTRYLMLDVSQLIYISSGGLRALFVLAKALSAKQETPSGREATKSGLFKSPYLKLLNPTPHVRQILDSMGFTMSIEIYSDRTAAIASF